jgi:preprotein translocase subunit YajC
MGSGFDIMAVVPFVLIFGVFYFLILRPQQQKIKKHQNMLANLRRGDRVVTNGGLIGTISKIVSDVEVQLELADDLRVRHVRGMITEVLAKTNPITSTGETPKRSAEAGAKIASSVVKKTGVSKAKKTSKAANRSTGKSKV